MRDEVLNNEPQISKVQQCPPLQSCGGKDTSHALAGVQDGPSPLEKDVGISSETMCAFTFGPRHSTPRNLLQIRRKHHLHEVIHVWVALLKVDQD